MDLQLRDWREDDREVLRTLVADPSLAADFDKFQGAHGLEHKLADPRLARDVVQIATVDGEPAGFVVAWRLPGEREEWVMVRAGVLERFRRRGVGECLVRAALARVSATAGARPLTVAAAAWQPAPGADVLAARLGFAHARWFWQMERPRGAVPAPAWPAGVTVRVFDGGDAMLRDWTDAYNASFTHHYRYVVAHLDTTRALVADPTFRADGLLLAYRDGAVAGFCRDELHASRGEVGTLGTVPAARGIGLGRALLRWGVGWLEAHTALPVTLLVDGENENALGLYRSEGFAVARTRRIWERAEAR